MIIGDSMKDKNNILKSNLVIFGAVVAIIILLMVFMFFNYFGGENKNTKKSKEKKDIVTLAVNPEYITLKGGSTNFITNETCNKSSIKRRYNLKLENGSILVNNLDTMENFIMNKINNVASMIEFNYKESCDYKMYALLTIDGEIYYTNNDITRITDVKKIDNEFIHLESELRFSELALGDDHGTTDLYGRTATGNLYKIDLR